MLKAPPFAWFVRIPDETAYLNAIKPQLEQHLREFGCGGRIHWRVELNFYQRGTQLKFEEGHLTIESWQPPDGSAGDAHFPADSFWSVICGQKSAAN